MKKMFPAMLDCPEKPRILLGLFYCILAFFSLPFALLLLMQGSFAKDSARAGIEIVFHVVNALAAVRIFREYLKDAFLNVQINTKDFLKTVGVSVAAILILALDMHRFFIRFGGTYSYIAAWGILPLAEVDLFTLSSELIAMSPLFGTLCLAVLSPFAISCLFYATVFAPVCCKRPWLAYLLVALAVAFPRICNGMTYWNPTDELFLYLAQLPMHLIACWSYQKTDTVWAPITVHASANLIACVLCMLMLW
jgi:hypothetical protein